MPTDDQALQDTALLHRPRITDLLRQASRHFMTTVTGGSQTGKAVAVTHYLQEADTVPVWIGMKRLDTLGDHRWNTFRQCFAPAFPAFASALQGMLYDPEPSLIDAVLSAWRIHMAAVPSVTLIFDNAHLIEDDTSSLTFLRNLKEAGLPNLKVILISNRRAHWNLRGYLRSGEIGALTAEDLAFTPTEVEMLLQQRGIPHSWQENTRIMDATEGWAFAVDAYITQCADPSLQKDAAFNPVECYALLENEWFLKYPVDTQLMLIRLALLPLFSDALIQAIAGPGDRLTFMRHLRGNQFIHYDAGDHPIYRIHVLYRQYLSTMTSYLSQEEIQRIYSVAGEWFLANGYPYEALLSYHQSGESEKGLAVIQRQPAPSTDKRVNRFVQDYIEALPSDYHKEHPMLQVHLAMLRMSGNDLEGALALLLPLYQAYQHKPQTVENRQLLGETCLCIGEIYLRMTRPDAVGYMREAAALLPQGSTFIRDENWAVPTESVILLEHCDAGDLQMMVEQYKQITALEDRLYARPMKGYAALFEAEAALAVFDIQRAVRLSEEAIRIARREKQPMIVCNAYRIAMEIAAIEGDYQQLLDALVSLDEYTKQQDNPKLRKHYESAQAWFYLTTGRWDSLPASVRDPYTPIDIWSRSVSCREMLLHATYWMSMRDYKRVMLLLETCKHHAQAQHLWLYQITVFLMEAFCYERMGETDKSVEAFLTACRMSYPNNITCVFIQSGEYMRTLIHMLRRLEVPDIDPQWLATVYAKSNIYAKRARSLYRQSQKSERQPASSIKLSPREKEVLSLMLGGLTREEMAGKMGISVHGVKRHISSLYDKLGATNRSSVIRMASVLGLVKKQELDEE